MGSRDAAVRRLAQRFLRVLAASVPTITIEWPRRPPTGDARLPPEPDDPFGPPRHWVERVRSAAPGLLLPAPPAASRTPPVIREERVLARPGLPPPARREADGRRGPVPAREPGPVASGGRGGRTPPTSQLPGPSPSDRRPSHPLVELARRAARPVARALPRVRPPARAAATAPVPPPIRSPAGDGRVPAAAPDRRPPATSLAASAEAGPRAVPTPAGPSLRLRPAGAPPRQRVEAGHRGDRPPPAPSLRVRLPGPPPATPVVSQADVAAAPLRRPTGEPGAPSDRRRPVPEDPSTAPVPARRHPEPVLRTDPRPAEWAPRPAAEGSQVADASGDLWPALPDDPPDAGGALDWLAVDRQRAHLRFLESEQRGR